MIPLILAIRNKRSNSWGRYCPPFLGEYSTSTELRINMWALTTLKKNVSFSCKIILFFFTTTIASNLLAAENFELHFKNGGLSQQMIQNIYSLFPEQMKKNLGRIEVEFIKMMDSKHNGIHYSFLKKINLNRELLNNSDKMTRVLAHEIAHAYDSKLGISSSSEFKVTFNWHGRKNKNQYNEASSDPYEFKNRKESFAVNFENYLYEKDFNCRRPSLYNFYARLFDIPAAKCNTNTFLVPIVLSSGDVKWTDLGKLKISSVHYLLAANGKEMMSRWGHSLIRFVVCAKRDKNDEKCTRNPFDDIILSFAADTGGNLNPLKGIVGGYNTTLHFHDYHSVKHEYQISESRDLKSYKFKINNNTIQDFISKATEQYWSYKGNYKFITNNCADETFRFFASVMWSSNLKERTQTTPLGLYSDLIKENIMEEHQDDEEQLVAKGLVLPRKQFFLKRSLLQINNILELDLNEKGIEFLSFTESAELIMPEIQKWKAMNPNDKQSLILLAAFEAVTEELKFQAIEPLDAAFKKYLSNQKDSSQEINEVYRIKKTFAGIPVEGEVELINLKRSDRIKEKVEMFRIKEGYEINNLVSEKIRVINHLQEAIFNSLTITDI